MVSAKQKRKTNHEGTIVSERLMLSVIAIVAVAIVGIVTVALASGTLPSFKANAREIEFSAEKR